MQRKYFKAIVISAIGIVALIIILFGVSYLSQKQNEQWYIDSQGGRLYDNDMVGLAYGALFIVSSLVAMVILGFAAVAWAHSDITSLKDALAVSAISGSLPFLVLLLGSVLLNVAANGIIAICLPCDILCLALACIGGVLAYGLARVVKKLRIMRT